jgi:hypothetical protein
MSSYQEEIEIARQQKDEFFRFHPQSPLPEHLRAGFKGLDYFPVNENLNLILMLEEFADKESIQMATSTGDSRAYQRWGLLKFEVEGQAVQLTLYYSAPHQHFFLPFMDASSGSESYSAGRYLDPHVQADGLVQVDFNQAYSPYCAYNPDYSCPIPPQENRLRVRIAAGEKISQG